uniref:Protein TIFY n=1 Tax=Aegilops tauschii subsp. strangulata TaxID=200361 RepID=A0A453D748_AEGTS
MPFYFCICSCSSAMCAVSANFPIHLCIYLISYYSFIAYSNYLCCLIIRSGMLPMSSPPANPGQLTIFYGGSVCVYDSVPPEKAQAIMLIAAAAAAASKSNGTTAVKPPAMSATNAIQAMLTRSLSLQSTSVANGQPQAVADPGSICKLQADLPIARRHSLQRFLEKRRDRLA